MSKTADQLSSELKALIDTDANKELECREYLQYVKESLVEETPLGFLYVEKERRGSSGDSDYILSCRTRDGTGVEATQVYIWELKAPQCYIFERDTENRLRPTKDLITAENQLLHYLYEQRGSEEFRKEFGVAHSDQVHFGGIIIGCEARRVSGKYQEEKKTRLYEKALHVRKTYFYDPIHLHILHWNYILNQLNQSTVLLAKPTPQLGILESQRLDPDQVSFAST